MYCMHKRMYKQVLTNHVFLHIALARVRMRVARHRARLSEIYTTISVAAPAVFYCARAIYTVTIRSDLKAACSFLRA
jgi:hypothetical protein